MLSPAWTRAARDLSHCGLDTRPASSLLTADLATNIAEHVPGAGTNQPDGADHDDKHHRQHDGVLGNVLTLFVVPQVARIALFAVLVGTHFIASNGIEVGVGRGLAATFKLVKRIQQYRQAARISHHPDVGNEVSEAAEQYHASQRQQLMPRHGDGNDSSQNIHRANHSSGARIGANVLLESSQHIYLHSVASGTAAPLSHSAAAMRKRLIFSSQNSSSSASVENQFVTVP